MTIKGIVQKLRTPVTTPSEDAWLFFFAAFACLAVMLIPPFSSRPLIYTILAAVNLLNGWRFLRKAKAIKAGDAESGTDRT